MTVRGLKKILEFAKDDDIVLFRDFWGGLNYIDSSSSDKDGSHFIIETKQYV